MKQVDRKKFQELRHQEQEVINRLREKLVNNTQIVSKLRNDSTMNRLIDYKKKIEYLNNELKSTNELLEKIGEEIQDPRKQLRKKKILCQKSTQCDFSEDDQELRDSGSSSSSLEKKESLIQVNKVSLNEKNPFSQDTQ